MNATESASSISVAPQFEGDVTVAEVVADFLRGKYTVAKLTVAGTLLALIISLLLPVKYTATTLIVPPQQQGQSLASLMVGQLGMLAGVGRELGLKNSVDLYVDMLRSESVQYGLVRQFNLMQLYRTKRMGDARKVLDSVTAIKPLTRQGLIRVTVEDRDAKRAADLANAYVEQLQALNQRMSMAESSQRREFFEKQLKQAKDELAAAELNMKQTQQKTGVLQLDSQARSIIQTFASVKAQIAAKEVQLQAMRAFATSQNPEYVFVQEQLTGLRDQLAKLLRNQNMAEGDLEVPTSKVPEVALAYLRAYRDLRYQEALYEIIARQYEAARLDEAKSASFAQVIDPATVPEWKSSPRRALIVVSGFMLAFFLSSAFVVARGMYRRCMADPVNRQRVDLFKMQLREQAGK